MADPPSPLKKTNVANPSYLHILLGRRSVEQNMSAENPRQHTKDLFLAKKKDCKKSRLSFSSSSGPILTFVPPPPPPPPSAVDKLGFLGRQKLGGAERRRMGFKARSSSGFLGCRRCCWAGRHPNKGGGGSLPSHFSVFGIAAPKSPLLLFLGGARRSSRGGGEGEILDRFLFKKPKRILMANLGRVCFNT